VGLLKGDLLDDGFVDLDLYEVWWEFVVVHDVFSVRINLVLKH
jgi:hypothetical protein